MSTQGPPKPTTRFRAPTMNNENKLKSELLSGDSVGGARTQWPRLRPPINRYNAEQIAGLRCYLRLSYIRWWLVCSLNVDLISTGICRRTPLATRLRTAQSNGLQVVLEHHPPPSRNKSCADFCVGMMVLGGSIEQRSQILE